MPIGMNRIEITHKCIIHVADAPHKLRGGAVNCEKLYNRENTASLRVSHGYRMCHA